MHTAVFIKQEGKCDYSCGRDEEKYPSCFVQHTECGAVIFDMRKIYDAGYKYNGTADFKAFYRDYLRYLVENDRKSDYYCPKNHKNSVITV